MPLRFASGSLVLVALLSFPWTELTAQKPPALPDLLKVAGDAVAQYAGQLGTVAADELFTQYETSSGRMSTPKRVSSVVVLVGQADGTVGTFRDLVAIDTVPVRARDDRLVALFKNPTAASIGDARAMTDATVRAYYSPNLRILDNPLLALDQLRTANQPNSTFKLEGMKKMDGVQVAVLKFNEKGTDHVMSGAAAVGRCWIEPDSGAIHQTELGFVMKGANIHGTVKFAKDAQLGLFVPSELDELVEGGSSEGGTNNMGGVVSGGVGGHEAMEGHARYSAYRRVASQQN